MKRGCIEGANCAECPFSAKDGKPNRPVRGIGPEDPQFLIIGDAPGKWESIKGVPFVGNSGKLVNKWALAKIGLRRENVWFDHVALCRPKPGASAAKRLKAAECCWPRLKADLEKMPGKPILAVGSTSAQQILADKKFKITQMSGTWSRRDLDGTGARDIIPTISPSTLFNTKNKNAEQQLHNLMYDAAKVADFSIGEGATEWPINIYYRHSDKRDAERAVEKICRQARKTGELSCDLETTGVDDHDAREPAFAKITSIGLATPKWGISIAVDVLTEKSWGMIRKILADPDVKIIFHNVLYDRPVLAWNGLNVVNFGDTMLEDHVAFPGIPHGLQRVVSRFMAVEPWKSEFRGKKDAQVPQDLYEYNAKDTLGTARIHGPLMQIIRSQGFEELHQLDLDMADIAFHMHMRGIPISKEKNEKLHETFLPKIQAYERTMNAFWEDPEKREEFLGRLAGEQAKGKRKTDPKSYGERVQIRRKELDKLIALPPEHKKHMGGLNPNARIQVAAWLLTEGVPLSVSTPSGGLSTSKDILETLKRFDAVNALLGHRADSKLYNTYIKGLWKYLRDWRLHPSWSVHKITGRWGSSPNVQNWTYDMLDQMEAPPGWKIVGADFAQLEARIIALLSGDEFLLSVFRDGHDLHGLCASAVWPDYKKHYDAAFAKGLRGDDIKNEVGKLGKEYKRKRDVVKRPEYGVFYGADIHTAYAAVRSDGYDIPMSAVQNIMDMIKQKMTGVDRWHNELIKAAKRDGEIRTTIFPRRRTFPMGNLDMNVIFNFPVQAEGANLMNRGLRILWNRIQDEFGHIEYTQRPCPILQVHDSVFTLCREEHAERIKYLTEDSLTQTIDRDGIEITFDAAAEIGDTVKEVK